MDLLDISHHNKLVDRGAVPEVPIVHKVNEGTFVDPQVRDRMPWIADRTDVFGGYTVLIVSKSTIREQIEQYAAVMDPYWRDGAFTQLDIEPWSSYSRPVTTEEIVEAGLVHDEIFGIGRYAAYINPNQLPAQFAELEDAGWLEGRLWLPDYSSDGDWQARRRGAIIHQYTSRATVPGFASGIDANTVLNWDILDTIANTPATTPPDKEPTTMFRWRHPEYADQFLIDGANVMRLTPAIAKRPDIAKLDLMVEDDAKFLKSCLARTGLQWWDLAKMG